jgi:hypothetical protein
MSAVFMVANFKGQPRGKSMAILPAFGRVWNAASERPDPIKLPAHD